jgi:hypothetical protein
MTLPIVTERLVLQRYTCDDMPDVLEKDTSDTDLAAYSIAEQVKRIISR